MQFYRAVGASALLLIASSVFQAKAEEHWGALACGLWRVNGVAHVAVGSAIDRGTEDEAVEAALAQCRSAGGQDCQIEGNGAFNRGCGFISAAHDNKGMVFCTSRPSAEEVLAYCQANGRICQQPIGGCLPN
ncbi:MAG TPA: DUF4189 domain-containing protein [Xanthobacteraceae bacterium]|nr:DUF4189 domain-containing protein [Xanthobacteraceae bacterium]